MEIITETVSRIAGDGADVYLFGSRLNDRARGGDVDILIEAGQRLPRIEQARIKMELERALGLPVDILVHVRDTEPTPFQTIAFAQAEPLRKSS
jgi:predicted nucleotidyltransferase